MFAPLCRLRWAATLWRPLPRPTVYAPPPVQLTVMLDVLLVAPLVATSPNAIALALTEQTEDTDALTAMLAVSVSADALCDSMTPVTATALRMMRFIDWGS